MVMFEKPITDRVIHAELHLPQGENIQQAKAVGRSINSDSATTETYNDNPMLNSMVYDVELSDSEIREYSANIIAENAYSQVNTDGHSHSFMDSIIDATSDHTAIEKADMYTHKKSQRFIQKTTQGWKLLCLQQIMHEIDFFKTYIIVFFTGLSRTVGVKNKFKKIIFSKFIL
jgi:hypothetical protein